MATDERSHLHPTIASQGTGTHVAAGTPVSAPCRCLVFRPDDPLIRQLGRGAAALRMLPMGYALLPLARGGKNPHRMLDGLAPPGQGGAHLATTDPAVITERARTDPGANWGAAGGMPSRAVIIDLDVKHGDDGPGNFARFLRDNQLPFPPAPHDCTPSGGLKIWLRTGPGEPVPYRPGILPGVDVIGDGSYAVIPPSMLLLGGGARPGEPASDPVPVPYTWTGCPCRAPAAPGWMRGWLASARGHGPAGAGGGESPDLEAALRNGLPPGERNTGIHRLACSLFRRYGTDGGGYAQAVACIREVWLASDRSLFGWPEVMTCVRSARSFIAGQEQAERDQARAWVQAMAGRRAS